MLTKNQKKYLKGLGNTLKPLVQIGKNGLTKTVIQSVDEVLAAHELLKIDVLKNCETECEELALDIASSTNSEIISQLGRKILLYRKSKEGKIKLPR